MIIKTTVDFEIEVTADMYPDNATRFALYYKKYLKRVYFFRNKKVGEINGN